MPETPDFQKTAEAFVQEQASIVPSMAADDLQIIEQMRRTAQKVAEHEHALTPLGRPESDGEMFQIAQERRAAEARLNALISARVNALSAKYKQNF